MSKLTRITQKIFGSSAGTNQISEFGSAAAGSPVYTNSPSAIQSLSNYLQGWFGAVLNGNNPCIEDMNALHYLQSYQTAYLMQAGVAEYDAGTTYYTGSLVNDGTGILYKSVVDNNVGNALTNLAYWTNNKAPTYLAYGTSVITASNALQPIPGMSLTLAQGTYNIYMAQSFQNNTTNTVGVVGSIFTPTSALAVDSVQIGSNASSTFQSVVKPTLFGYTVPAGGVVVKGGIYANTASAIVTEIDNAASIYFLFSNFPTSGSFSFNFLGNSVSINYNDSASTIQTKLQTLSGLNVISVGGSPYANGYCIVGYNTLSLGSLVTITNNTLAGSGSPSAITYTASPSGLITGRMYAQQVL